jgi:hypothetical protein
MISATDPDFFIAYPNGAHVYDARGRRIYHVISFNPETGEVIRLPIFTGPLWELHHRICEGLIWACGVQGGDRLPTAHGFHPAPLRIVPCAP